MIRPALHPEATQVPDLFTCKVDARLCVGAPGQTFLFGGAGLGLAVSALEQATGRVLIWASAQYLSFTTDDRVLSVEITRFSEGRNVTHAQVLMRDGDKTIICVNAALGARDGYSSDQWRHAPEVPEPAQCPLVDLWPPQGGKLHEELEMRLPEGGRIPGSGRLTVWIKSKEDLQADTPLLAVFADLVPSGVAAARGSLKGGNSVDNTLRIVRHVATEWVLCDIHTDAAHNGFAHAQVHLYAQDGTLVAVGNQTVMLRE